MLVSARRRGTAPLALSVLIVACGLLATMPAAGAEDGALLDRLMTLLAQRRHGVADFDETQYLELLKRPVHSSGVLRYDAPDHLEQRTLKPRPQNMLLDHGMLTLESGKHQRTLPLQDYPQLAPLIDSMRATLAGDRAALAQRFAIELRGDLDHWQLLLRPLDSELAASVQRIRLSGERDAVLQVEVQQSDGDRSLIDIRPRE